MTEAAPVAVPGLHRRALVDLDALAANLTGSDSASLDVRANAYGHDLALVARIASDCGIRSLMVSTDDDAATVRPFGFREVTVGRAPADPAAAAIYGLQDGGRPVLTVVGELISVKRVGAGAGVSYGYTHRTEHPTTLGLVALGYADGIPRLASNRARIAVDGVQHPLVGRIAMDQFVVDLGGASPVPGTDVVVFGSGDRGEPRTQEWAVWTERSAPALTAGLASRVGRELR